MKSNPNRTIRHDFQHENDQPTPNKWRLMKFLKRAKFFQIKEKMKIENAAKRDIVDGWAEYNAQQAKAKRMAMIRQKFANYKKP